MPTTLKTLAVFAHPGHELQCFGSLGALRARIAFLTDASAFNGRTRTQKSVASLRSIGLEVSNNLTVLSDNALYAMLLDADEPSINQHFMALQNLLRCEAPDVIVTDTAEGYNPAHDYCHFLVVFAAQKVCPAARVLEVPLTEHPHDLENADEADCLILDLDAQASQTKQAAITEYCDTEEDMLRQEVAEMQDNFGTAVLDREVLRPPLSLADYLSRFVDDKPFFERHGERRVREEKYDKILRLHPHLAFALDVVSRSD